MGRTTCGLLNTILIYADHSIIGVIGNILDFEPLVRHVNVSLRNNYATPIIFCQKESLPRSRRKSCLCKYYLD